MLVKYMSTTHHVMLVLSSGRNRPKTLPNIRMITTKDPSKIQRALDHLKSHNLVVEAKGEKGQAVYALSILGKEELVAMAKANSLITCDML